MNGTWREHLLRSPQAERKTQSPNLNKTWEGFFSEALYSLPFYFFTPKNGSSPAAPAMQETMNVASSVVSVA